MLSTDLGSGFSGFERGAAPLSLAGRGDGVGGGRSAAPSYPRTSASRPAPSSTPPTRCSVVRPTVVELSASSEAASVSPPYPGSRAGSIGYRHHSLTSRVTWRTRSNEESVGKLSPVPMQTRSPGAISRRNEKK